ncbi:MAG: hypothetical protein DRR16_24220 [Candidatus Parabeggiatoa sp. nov. 3]|nr:MAG: hypothetical protein DRR00_07900 [Gammaproteobacteria bacterium]RKZ68259.1 MAG: hypothetical protein DRQ99_04265 [Gammaproteobacteria bacterium]RKZ80239.1 MAG: hypothetical protein DRR16_24220 [Gammaproteobacteria bacterium]
MRENYIYALPVNLYATGRTGAGKTSLGNSLLASPVEAPIMETHGYMDCTRAVQYVALKSNLRYYDLPGIGSDENLENINRAALCIPQIDDHSMGVVPIEEITILDFSNPPHVKPILVKDHNPTLAHWQAPANQLYVGPDIILYVVAPHGQFIREDRSYLSALLKAQQLHSQNNKVIFALNLYHHPDGTLKPTPQEIEDVQRHLTQIYQRFYNTIPPIVEIDALRGTGLHQMTELMCQILPAEKIGNIQQVLKAELKQIAYQERSRRYRQLLIQIASRLATYPVDTSIGKGLLREAYAAICDYSIRVFNLRNQGAKETTEMSALVERLARETKRAREQAIKVKVKDVEEQEVTSDEVVKYEPKIEEVEVTEQRPEYYTETVLVKRSGTSRFLTTLSEIAAVGVTSPIWLAQMAGTALGLRSDKKMMADNIIDDFNPDFYKKEKVAQVRTKIITRIEERFMGLKEMREKITRKVPVVVETEQEVGKKYLQGGYKVVENVLAIGLGMEKLDSASDFSIGFEEAFQAGVQQVGALLSDHQEQINQLSENEGPDIAEAKIRVILEKALI